ncbi:MAG: sugar transferase [Nocardiaceae bacterium]|nr:sugar transferase [Nocardiaceae bacterium]
MFDEEIDAESDVFESTVSGLKGSRRDWEWALVLLIRLSDAAAICGAVGVGHLIRLGRDVPSTVVDGDHLVSYWWVSVTLAVAWMAALSVFSTRSPRVLGGGIEEYRRIISATLYLFGFIAILSLGLQVALARGFLAIVLPLGLAFLLLSRWLWRKVIVARRRAGLLQTFVMVVGSERAAIDLARTFGRDSSQGIRIVGACVPGREIARGTSLIADGHSIPVVSTDFGIVEAARMCGADTVAVSATDSIGQDGLQRLVWALEPHGIDLVLAPGIADIATERLVMRPVGGLPLIHVERPTYRRSQRVSKAVFDILFATIAILLTAPVLIAAAVAIKVTSRGPIIYRSERIGFEGRPFTMYKFRTMVNDAERQLASVTQLNEAAGPLFKIHADPRITPVGRFLRKHSLDELPQFFNVLTRDMSIIGPRPPLASEVATYDGHTARRLLVNPGISGLWQVSGRSDLSWEEARRLDIMYVENWSMWNDLLIIVKTILVVLNGKGAY